jgi:hypothetical protein
MAAVKLSDRLWVALGDRPPARWSDKDRVDAAVHALVADGGWPPEPPPDVDSDA